MKIIPAIDIMEGQVVRLLKGNPNEKTVYGNDPVQMALKWEKQGADMLHLVDLDATLQRGSNHGMIKKITQSVLIPVQVAGGLRDRKIIEESLQISQRIVVGTIALKNPELLMEISNKFGKDRIVISVDHNNGMVVTHGWQQRTDIDLFDALDDFAKKGFTEFLITNISRDGTLEGPDTENLQKACKISGINVIASGGISGPADIPHVRECGAYGVILGKALYDGKISIKEAKTA
ncbi:1-(5-phosphoribosyl)-5-[(5-phosphoribosylamino)methylideneamino]imidazole-4-carboxamide isomerase [Candidatus Nitrosotenuis uzonensis]|uniref:1-(5-phosphoribosyl)-5-[(5- phosphoribosylamino)methylideneamino]imidazole-4- carboxamide isomerase n=1 Tax=Candidatus Nitrosotenuis uzonensis TaxID=1407055 RepID=UPI00064E28A8|nr:1-(5-phosphoribosyl)-5-[(5-phosphoribosylamino)methylideneamino]imidazole-4-carboxamide isomerase [Candidatus Nitrosotenuis uzonensis]